MSLVPWSVRRVILLVIFSLGLIGGALLLWAAFAFSVGVKPCVELSQSELRVPDTDCVYHIKDMIVVDRYAEFGNDVQTDDRYYLIWFEDGTGTPYCASLEVDSKADISLQCKEYAESEETLVGELVLDGYFTCASMERGHAMDEWYFGNIYDQYKENLTGEPLEYHFRYEAAEYEDYVKGSPDPSDCVCGGGCRYGDRLRSGNLLHPQGKKEASCDSGFLRCGSRATGECGFRLTPFSE